MPSNVRKLKVVIERPAGEAYDFLSLPETFRKWASGAGDNEVRHSERNSHGVLDHAVRTPQGEVYVPLRVLPKGGRCELDPAPESREPAPGFQGRGPRPSSGNWTAFGV